MARLLRDMIPTEELDYQALLGALKGYAQPKQAVAALLERGDVVRVKKGLYVFGPALARRSFSRERLANLMYGPSYVSLDSALAYHGMIPERVEAVTSVTRGRRRRFQTPVGLFLYHPIPARAYAVGVDQIEWPDGQPVLIASREKALADKVALTRHTHLRSRGHMRRYLLDDLRIEPDALASLRCDAMKEISDAYGTARLAALFEVISS